VSAGDPGAIARGRIEVTAPSPRRNEKPLISGKQWNMIESEDDMEGHYLLLVDLKKSTRLTRGAAERVFGQLEGRLVELNRTLDPPPVLGLTISYGDEVAGLFDSPIHLYNIVDQVRDWLYPEAGIRFVAARGAIGRLSEDIRQVGGEVFKRADEAIRAIKRDRRFCRWLIGGATVNTTLDALTEISNAVLEDMTEYQREVYRQLAAGLNQTDIAALLSKHRQSVSDAVKRGHAESVLEARAAINGLLAEVSSMENDRISRDNER
jgi:DNA-binding CsgD family transcriptional regulator